MPNRLIILFVVGQPKLDSVRSGPWLLVHARGSAPLAIVEQVRHQCEEAGITLDTVPIESCVPEDGPLYTGLILVLPTNLDENWPQLVTRLDALVRRYRLTRRQGLKALLDRQVEWHRAGVVQAIGPRAILAHPMLSTTQQQICVRHYLSPDPPNILHPYSRSAAPPPTVDGTLDGDARCLPTWRYLRTWGILNITSIPALRAQIETCRAHFEDQRFPALYRPIPGIPANRLSIILDAIPHKPTTIERKTYLENGARVWRYVRDELRKLEPTFNRPNERTNTRDAQKDLRLLYAALCPLDEYLKLLPQSEWEPRFMVD